MNSKATRCDSVLSGLVPFLFNEHRLIIGQSHFSVRAWSALITQKQTMREIKDDKKKIPIEKLHDPP